MRSDRIEKYAIVRYDLADIHMLGHIYFRGYAKSITVQHLT